MNLQKFETANIQHNEIKKIVFHWFYLTSKWKWLLVRGAVETESWKASLQCMSSKWVACLVVWQGTWGIGPHANKDNWACSVQWYLNTHKSRRHTRYKTGRVQNQESVHSKQTIPKGTNRNPKFHQNKDAPKTENLNNTKHCSAHRETLMHEVTWWTGNQRGETETHKEGKMNKTQVRLIREGWPVKRGKR